MKGYTMSHIRSLPLPPGVTGRVYLTGMPGRTDGWETARDQIAAEGIDTVLCLTPMSEIERHSPDYAAAIKDGKLAWRQWMMPMEDFGLPESNDAYLAQVKRAAEHLRAGGAILIHCGYGFGRTGTTAACVLMALGMAHDDALAQVDAAGSYPEDPRQKALIRWVGEKLSGAPSDQA